MRRTPGSRDVPAGYFFAAALHLAGNGEQRFQFLRYGGAFWVALDVPDELLVVIQMPGRHRFVYGLTKEAIVPGRDESRDQLTLAWRQNVRPAEKKIGELIEGLGGFRAEDH